METQENNKQTKQTKKQWKHAKDMTTVKVIILPRNTKLGELTGRGLTVNWPQEVLEYKLESIFFK